MPCVTLTNLVNNITIFRATESRYGHISRIFVKLHLRVERDRNSPTSGNKFLQMGELPVILAQILAPQYNI